MKYYDRLNQYMGNNLKQAQKVLIEFAVPFSGTSESLFDEHGNLVCYFAWSSTPGNRVTRGPWVYDK